MATLFKNESVRDHHYVALLFAYLAKACIDEYGCEGKAAAMSVAIDFGEARGREMRRIVNPNTCSFVRDLKSHSLFITTIFSVLLSVNLTKGLEEMDCF